MAAARRPTLFLPPYDVPDTLEGRFDALVLHAFLVVRRLAALPAPAPQLAQDLSDEMFRALDRALRDGEQVMRTMRGGLRAVGALGSLLAGLRERARSYDRDEDWDDDSIYGDDPGDAGERPHASEPDTGGPH